MILFRFSEKLSLHFIEISSQACGCVQNVHTISFNLICLIYIESSFDGVHTFALTDHSLGFNCRQTPLILTKNFSIPKTINNHLIIICKGIQKNHKFQKCEFIHDGNWEDVELVEHQKYHKSLEGQNNSWLGFDVSQSSGKLSSRDGKRI